MKRLLACISLALSLGGCWYSEFVTLPKGNLVTPPISGEYRLTNVHDNDATYWRAKVSGNSAAIDYYSKDGTWKSDGFMYFMPFDAGYYLVEWDEEDYSEFYLAKVHGDGSFSLIEPACDSTVLDAGLAMYDDDEDACAFDDYGELVTAARRLAYDLQAGRSDRANSDHYLVRN